MPLPSAPPPPARPAHTASLAPGDNGDAAARAARLAARLLAAPAAFLWLADRDTAVAGGAWGPVGDAEAAQTLGGRVAAGGVPVAVADLRGDSPLAGRDRPPAAALVGTPVRGADGRVAGALCVVDAAPRAWTAADVAALVELAAGLGADLTRVRPVAASAVDAAAAADPARAPAPRPAATDDVLRALLDDTTELVCATDDTGRISYVNRAWERTFGYPLHEARALRPVEMVAREDQGRYLAAAARLMRGEPTRDFEAVLITRDGRRRVCRGWATPVMGDTAEGWRCVGTRAGYVDVTAERHAEAMRSRLAATLEISPDLVAVATKTGRLIFLNRAGRALVGLADDAELSAISLGDLWPDFEQSRMLRDAIPAAIEAGSWEGETLLLSAGGETIPVSQVLVAHPSNRANEAPFFISATMHDLRDRVRTEAAIREHAAEMRAAAAVRDREARLRALEERLRLAVEAGGAGIFDWDVAGGGLAWDERCRAAFGLAADAAVSLPALDARLHPADRTRVRRLVARAIRRAAGGALHAEFRVEWGGAVRWLEVRARAHSGGQARRPARLVGTVLDVTERKLVELALAEAHATLERRVVERTADLAAAAAALGVSEARFRAASEGSLDALLFVESVRDAAGAVVDFAIVDCNARAAALARMPREALLGRHLCALFPEHRTGGAFERYVQAAAGGGTIEVELTARDPRGAARWLRVQAAPLGDGLALSTRDISERKRLETALAAERAFLMAVLDNLSDAVVACDADGRLTLLNRAARELHGMDETDASPLDEWAERYGLHQVDGVTRMRPDEVPLARAFRGEAVAEAELVVLPRDGHARALLASGRAFHDAAGARLGAVVALHDVTERRAAERLKDQLIGTVSHELRTPLTAIKGALDLLGTGVQDAGSVRLLQMASRNTARLVRMVNDLLDVERISSGAAPLSLEALPVDALIAAACESLRMVTEHAGLRLVVERMDGAPGAGHGTRTTVWADADRVTQVLANLVGNAAKFSEAGGTITVRVAPGETGVVRVSVRDEGRGISADKLERIFNRFEQADAADAKEKGGAGLGLAICRAIVRQHGGRIWAESAGAGRGSTFHFTLPTAEAALTRPPA